MQIAEYFAHPALNNSRLTELKKSLLKEEERTEYEEALLFGQKWDAVTTGTPQQLDALNPTPDERTRLANMAKSCFNDPLNKSIFSLDYKRQYPVFAPVEFEYNGIKFTLDCKCLVDVFLPAIPSTFDHKSTNAETQKQFLNAVYFFDWHRSRVFYMKVLNAAGIRVTTDYISATSKHYPHKVFHQVTNENDAIYLEGEKQLNFLAYKYWALCR